MALVFFATLDPGAPGPPTNPGCPVQSSCHPVQAQLVDRPPERLSSATLYGWKMMQATRGVFILPGKSEWIPVRKWRSTSAYGLP